jgi:uncharacterized protein YkwD
MHNMRQGFVLGLALIAPVALAQARLAPSPVANSNVIQAEAWQIVALANQARAAAGAGPLRWDPALATAARQHCLRMAAEGPIAHRYAGEPDITERAGQAGAHFSLIEENVAVGPDPASIHEAWMNSPGHRSNLLNPDVDRVGVAVVASRGVLYAVADYERAVPVLTQAQVEAAVANLVSVSGVSILADPGAARAYCAQPRGARGSSEPRFLMRWQGADLTQLPQSLLERLSSGQYRQAAVGSCPPQDVEGTFTAYRIAVLLY